MRRVTVLLWCLALMLGACSSGSEPPVSTAALPDVEVRAPQIVADAVRAAQEAGTAAFQFGFLDENALGTTSIEGDGIATLDGQQGEAEFVLTILGAENNGVARIVDGVRYVMSGGNGMWERSTSKDEPGLTDLAGRLQTLLRDDVELTEEGPEEIAGAATTKYSYSVPDSSEGDVNTSQAGGSFWVDADGRLRQFDTRRIVEQGGVTRIVADLVTITEFGVDVQVEAPPSDMVSDSDGDDSPI